MKDIMVGLLENAVGEFPQTQLLRDAADYITKLKARKSAEAHDPLVKVPHFTDGILFKTKEAIHYGYYSRTCNLYASQYPRHTAHTDLEVEWWFKMEDLV